MPENMNVAMPGGFNEAGGGIWVESVHELQGILNWYMADYDGDGAEELLVLTLDNQRTLPSDYNSEIVRNGVDLQMYELVDRKPVLQATYHALEPVLGYGDEEEDGIFLQKKDGTVYICGSCSNGIYLYADGTVLNSFHFNLSGRKVPGRRRTVAVGCRIRLVG